MVYAVRFEQVTKRYPRGGQRYASLRDELARGGRRLAGRLAGQRAEARGTLALRDVSFEVEQGESFALIGPNGAGKTTALKLISRISYPSDGRIRVRGRVGALIEVGSGVHPELSARENIWLYGQILGMSKADVRRRFDEIVDFAELGHVLDTPVKLYSSGMQLRLGFAIASHLEPEVFVVDEALAVGDAGFQVRCIEQMTRLVAQGRTLLFVSHTLPLVREVCPRGVLLDNGRIAASGPTGALVDRYLRDVGRVLSSRAAVDEPLEVTALQIEPERGETPLRTGDAVSFEFALSARQRLPDAVLGVGITDGRPGNLVTMSMLSERSSVDLAPGLHRLACRVGSLPLLPGSYEVWFSASAGDRGLYYAQPQVIGTLVVSEGPADRKRDQLFAHTAGFGPVYVPYTMGVARSEVADVAG